MNRARQSGRRAFLCFCCAGLAAAAGGALAASDPAPPFRRTILGTQDYPDGKHVVIQASVEIDPEAVIPRHTHPGIEAAFIVEGGAELSVAGQPVRQVKAGDAFEIPVGAAHGLRNGKQTTKVLVTYVVEKDKPLASPAPS